MLISVEGKFLAARVLCRRGSGGRPRCPSPQPSCFELAVRTTEANAWNTHK